MGVVIADHTKPNEIQVIRVHATWGERIGYADGLDTLIQGVKTLGPPEKGHGGIVLRCEDHTIECAVLYQRNSQGGVWAITDAAGRQVFVTPRGVPFVVYDEIRFPGRKWVVIDRPSDLRKS